MNTTQQSPEFPKSPQFPEENILESLLAGLPAEVRESTIRVAREHGLSDHDPIWTVILAIRAGDTQYTQAVQDIQKTISDFREAARSASHNLGETGREQGQTIAEVRELVNDIQAVATEATSKLTGSEEYCEKMSRWAFAAATGALLFCGFCFVLISAGVSTLGEIQTERENLVSAVAQVASLQKLAGLRILLTNEKSRLEADWKQLQTAVEQQGMIPQLENEKARLEGKYADLKTRFQELSRIEETAYEKYK